MKQSIKFLLSAFAAMFVGVTAFAQLTTSSLNGLVADASGEPVIGAAVIATHTESGTSYATVTNNEGHYYINGMRAGGPYKVEVSCLGYRTVAFTDVTLQLAESLSLNAKLEDDAQMLSEAIVISNATSKFAAEKTGAATNISNRQIADLPTVSRSITDVTRLSPYGGNGMSFAGADGRTANFTVDGANFNNNFGLEDDLPGGGNPISIDAIEEMQVVISPYDVRQTNFIGGGVNAITKSGTNTFKGSAYIYHRNENMRGDTVEGETVAGARDKDRNTTYGFTLGGPIVKNKLFFFANFEYSKIPTVANRWRGSTDGVGNADANISRTTLEDLEKVSKFLKDKYGYDTGSWTDFPANESNMKVLARLDWNINDKNHLALRYNYTLNKAWYAPSSSSMDGGTRSAYGRTSLYGMSYANSMYSKDNIVHSLSLDLNSRISDNLSNQFLATLSLLNDVRGTDSSDFPFIDIRYDDGSAPMPYISAGYELFTWNNAVHNTHIGIKDDITWYGGKHKVTAGINYEYQMADNSYLRNGTGYYRYLSLDDFLNERAPEVVCLTYGYDGEENPAARVQFHKLGLYAQDEWQATENFKLTYGVRFDGLFFDNKDLMTNKAVLALNYGVAHSAEKPDEHVDGCRHIDTGKWPNANISVSPRVGFVWDVLGDKSLKFRGGTGLFSGRLPLVFFTNMPTNSGMVQYQAMLGPKGDQVDMSQFAGKILTRKELYNKLVELGYPSTPGDGTLPSNISGVDPKFKMPQVWKTSLAIDYAFPTSFPFSVSAEAIYNKTVNGVCLTDWNVKPVDGFTRFNGVDNRPIYQKGNYLYTSKSAYVLENTHRGYGWSATASINMEPVKGLYLSAAYTHTASKEITGMPGSNASSVLNNMGTVNGPNDPGLHNSQYVTPDRFFANLSYSDKCGNHFGIIYETWRGGYNYSYMTQNDINGDGYNYDLIFIPTDEQVANGDFRFVSQDDADRFLDYVHNDKYLSKHQGEYAEAYSVYSPWVHRIDFSYKHDFKVRIGKSVNTLQLSFDLKNALNIFNSNWGVSKYMNPDLGEGRILKYEGVDKEGYATFSTAKAYNGTTETWQRLHSIGQCWYASVGIRYMFN